MQGAFPFFLSFSLSLHFPAVYFGQLVARSHSAAVPMVIAAEIATGGLGWWARQSGRDSVALFRRDRGLWLWRRRGEAG